METRVRESSDLLEKLFEAYTIYHTRRRLRPGCDCRWCRKKLELTTKIMHLNMREMVEKYYLPRSRMCCSYHDETVKDAIRAWRKEKAREARRELSEIAKEII